MSGVREMLHRRPPAKPLPPSVLRIAQAMRASGEGWMTIQNATGVCRDALRRRLEPGYAETRNATAKRSKQKRSALLELVGAAGAVRMGVNRVTPEEAVMMLATVPDDTRDYTARLLGDPLPGRSALDKRRGISVTGGDKSSPSLTWTAGWRLESRATTKPDLLSVAPPSPEIGSALQGGPTLFTRAYGAPT